MRHVHGHVDLKLIDDPAEIAKSDSPLGKSFIIITAGDVEIAVTTNIAEMIGGAGSGLRKRREDAERRRKGN